MSQRAKDSAEILSGISGLHSAFAARSTFTSPLGMSCGQGPQVTPGYMSPSGCVNCVLSILAGSISGRCVTSRVDKCHGSMVVVETFVTAAGVLVHLSIGSGPRAVHAPCPTGLDSVPAG